MSPAGPKTKIVAAMGNPATGRRSPIPTFHKLAQQGRFKIKAILMVTAGHDDGIFCSGLELGESPIQTFAHSRRVIDETVWHPNVQDDPTAIVGRQNPDTPKIGAVVVRHFEFITHTGVAKKVHAFLNQTLHLTVVCDRTPSNSNQPWTRHHFQRPQSR